MANLNAPDPQIFARIHEHHYVNQLIYQPHSVEVLEIFDAPDKTRSVKTKSVAPDDFCSWVYQACREARVESSSPERAKLRIILGRSPRNWASTEELPVEFPGAPPSHGKSIATVPFSQSNFRLLVEKLDLPAGSSSLLLSQRVSAQRHVLDGFGTRFPKIGITMRRPNWGVLRINLALSLSYNPNTGTTQGFLLGCSDFQLMYIRQQLTQLASLASHPALIPTLISCYVCSLLENSVSDLWSKLLKFEWESGQTGIQMHDALGQWPASENKDYTALTKDALGIAQLATTRQSSADTLIQSIDSVQECLKYVNSVAPPQRKDAVNSASTAIEEQLRLATENAKELLSRSQFIKERTQTQITAIYNLIAQNDSLTNRGLAVDSHAMAVASRRDSSAMKAIGLLTMVFLPATFIATLFAMPIFQWNAEPGTSVVSDRFWVYWAVTLPLTAIVVLVWLAWLRLTTRNRPAPRDKAGKTRFGDSRPKIDNFDLEMQAHRHDPSTYSRGILKMRHDCPTAMREGVAPRKCISGNDVSRRASSSSQCTKAKAKGVEPQHCRPPPRSQAAEPQGNAKANGSPNSESSVAESFGNLKVEFRTGLSESEQRAILEEIRDVKAFFKEGTVEADDGGGGRVPRDAGTGDPCGDTRGPADRVGDADGGWEEFDVHVAGVLPPGWGDDHGDAVGGVGE